MRCIHCIATVLVLATFTIALAQDPTTKTSSAITLDNPGEGTPYRLVYKFATGQFAHFEQSSAATMDITYEGGVTKQTNESQVWKQLRVVSVDENGQATLEPIITRVKMTAQIGNLNAVTFDSDNKAAPIPKEFTDVANSVGKAFTRAVLGSNGELVKIIALDGAPVKMAEAAAKNDPSLNFLVVLPKEPVGLGAVWRDHFQVPVTVGNNLSQLVKLQRQYTLTKVAGSIATIATRISVVTPINDEPSIAAQLCQRTTTGTIEFDLDRGLIVSQSAAVNQQVVNAFGPKTILQATSETREKLITAAAGVQPAALQR